MIVESLAGYRERRIKQAHGAERSQVHWVESNQVTVTQDDNSPFATRSNVMQATRYANQMFIKINLDICGKAILFGEYGLQQEKQPWMWIDRVEKTFGFRCLVINYLKIYDSKVKSRGESS